MLFWHPSCSRRIWSGKSLLSYDQICSIHQSKRSIIPNWIFLKSNKVKNWRFWVRDYLFFSTDCNILVLVLWWYWFERLACSSGHDAGTLLVNVLEPGIWYSVFMFSEFEKKNQWRRQKIWQIMKESLVHIALKPFLHGNAAQGAKNFFKINQLNFWSGNLKKKSPSG